MKAQDTNVHRLLQGTKVFVVPNFQRRYAWRLKQWAALWSDVVHEYQVSVPEEYSESLEGHFLGSVVLHPAPGPASTVSRYLVIDGQQRLTTLLVMLAALRDVRGQIDPSFSTRQYDDQYLTNPYNKSHLHRLVPTKFDREAYVRTVHEGKATGGIGQAYGWFRERLTEAATNDGIDLERLSEVLLLRLILVEIDTSPSDSINSIFNTLNSKGLPLSAADLVRNEFLLNLSDTDATSAYEEYWLPIEQSLVRSRPNGDLDDSALINFFLAVELQASPNVSSKDLFTSFERRLRRALSGKPSAERSAIVTEELERLRRDVDVYLVIIDPDHSEGAASAIPSPVRRVLSELATWGSAPHVPVSFAILSRYCSGRSSATDTESALRILLGFLVRRALAGIATNNLNRLLSPLVSAISESAPSLEQTLGTSLTRPGYRWPTDAEVLTASESTPLYAAIKRSQSKYILSQLNIAADEMEHPQLHSITVEHIMPQNLAGEWKLYLSREGADLDEAQALLHTIGNLTLTGYNSSLSDGSFESKKLKYRNSSIALNRALEGFVRWTPDEIRARSRTLASACLGIWPGPRRNSPDVTSENGFDQRIYSLKDILNSLPDGGWTTPMELSSVLGATVHEIQAEAATLPAQLVRLVRSNSKSTPSWYPTDLAAAVADQDRSLGTQLNTRPLGAVELQGLVDELSTEDAEV